MKHITTLIASFACFTSTLMAQSISQHSVGTFYQAGVDTDGSARKLGQTFLFPGGYMDTLKLAAYSVFTTTGEHTAVLSIHSYSADNVGQVLWTSPVTLSGLGDFYPPDSLEGLSDVEVYAKWTQVDIAINSNPSGFYSLAKSFFVGHEFGYDTLALVIELDNYVDSGRTEPPVLHLRGNCYAPYCGSNTITNPYVDGNALRGTPLSSLTWPEADIAFEISYHNIETAVADNEVKEVSMFPNPATDEVTLVASGYNSYEVYDAVGRLVSNGILANHQVTLDVTDWHAGYYAVRVLSQDNRSFMKQLVVI